MLSSWQGDNTIIDCVRIRAQLSDPGAVQQKIGHLLRNAALRPSRLPLAAILFLRKLQDPAPGTRWNYERVHPPREWEESATRELDRLAAQAVRPALASVPPSAQAVLFLDRAELLACLAADWLQGTLRANWWWVTLLKRGDPDLTVFREWTQSPEFLPAAFEGLVARSRATEFLRRLPDEVVGSLRERMLQVFAVPEACLVPANGNQGGRVESSSKSPPVPDLDVREIALGEPKLRPEPRESPIPGLAQPEQPVTVGVRAREVSRAEPWLPFVPEASVPCLPLQKRVLLAQALMLRRAPTRARTIAFQREMAEWQLRAETQRDLPTEPRSAPAASERWQAPEPAATGNAIMIEPRPGNLPKVQLPAATEIESPTTGPVEPDREESPILTTAKAASCLPDVETSFAGVFFLLNVALYLRLYADFTSPRESGLDLNIWDFICLLGLELIGEEIKEDGLFEVLASLAGRNKFERPGAYFEPPDEWNVPAAWLAPFPEHFERKEVIRNGRLQVVHPAGFVLADRQFAAEAPPGDSLARWLRCIGGYIRARIARAMGRDDAAELLCRIPGRVACTSTRVDVFYSLESYPIEIRLAGLDRDPGWIPAAGHYVAYHFQC